MAALGLLAGMLSLAAPAAAQNTQSWVASDGSDANNCTRASPCANFTRALSRTNAGGQINCVDRLTSNSVTIGKSVTIECTPGGVIRNTTNGIAILIDGNSSTVVRLSGLVLDGQGAGGTGIRVITGRKLFVDHVTIRDFKINGIYLQTDTGALDVAVSDSAITNTGRSPTLTGDGGIGIYAPDPIDFRLTVARTTIAGGTTSAGIYAQSAAASGNGVAVTVRDSIITGNQTGVRAVTNGRPVHFTVLNSQVSASGAEGILATGAAAEVVVRRTRITGNATGVSAASGGQVTSGGGNLLAGNGSDGAFTGTLSAQ
jgi:hypothetical protein